MNANYENPVVAQAVLAAVDNAAYDATSWSGVTNVAPSKDAVRGAVHGNRIESGSNAHGSWCKMYQDGVLVRVDQVGLFSIWGNAVSLYETITLPTAMPDNQYTVQGNSRDVSHTASAGPIGSPPARTTTTFAGYGTSHTGVATAINVDYIATWLKV